MGHTSALRAAGPGTGPAADARALRSFGALAWAAAAATFALILLGAAVVGTSSGLTCLGWPLCRGRLIPPLVWPIVVEWMHRVGAQVALGGMLVATHLAPVALVVHQGLAALLACLWLVLALRAGWMGATGGDAPRMVGSGAAEARGREAGGRAP